MNEKRYIKLEAGERRREGDEVKHLFGGGLHGTNGTGGSYKSNDFNWHPVQLVGHPILASDLIAAEFRRPLPF